ncbi:MAG TPA: alpha-amylase family glycosyl hydrolase [Streptosporangiaceae bacterium]|nr:alpha-amylase family glycosyl hydrolase [Streptosporangiaceae bacterium]
MIVRPAPAWLADAVLYQIYPQSFADSNDDGIGDFPGLVERLDYLSWLGVNTVWISPCFASPFRDAGYDVSDYFTIAPRYGDDDDLVKLVEAARRRDIRILLDLVPGHTSDQHPWFRAALDDPADDRYIWADRPAERFVPSPGPRPGYYLKNFFDSQPALNFGYARSDEAEPWRQPVDAAGPRANRAAVREIMAHWLDLGVAGFRVDMAFSLVKDDPGGVETARLWSEMRDWLDAAYPDAMMLSEWGSPEIAIPAGFHADFFLHFVGRALRSLWDTGTGATSPTWEQGECFFDAAGKGSPAEFLETWRAAVRAVADAGHIVLPTANHDFSRLACHPRTRDQLGPAFAFVLTWPTLPAIYYGDEIGMRYIPGLPDKEGSRLEPTYNRAGSRTPMQWDGTANAGFSAAPADRLYLPIDPDPDRPTVAAQRADEDSLLNQVRRLIALRKAEPALGAAGAIEVWHAGYPFVYVRGGSHLVVINPRREPADLAVADRLGRADESARPLEVRGVTIGDGQIRAGGFSYGVFALT